MDENFKMGFKNFLITRKLKELLAMRDNEKDPDKIESIQQVINLRVNYLDDNNRKLTGKKLKEHKEKIREKYSGTKYYKYINIIHENKSKKYTVALLLVLFIGAGLGGKILIGSKNITHSTSIKHDDLATLLKAKERLGKLFYENFSDFKNSYLNYEEAFEISKQLKERNSELRIEREIILLKKRAYIYFEKRLGESNITIKELDELYNTAKTLGLNTILGKIHRTKANILLGIGKIEDLKAIKNNYIMSTKFLNSDDLEQVKLKLIQVEVLENINTLIEEAYIEKLNSNFFKAEQNCADAKEKLENIEDTSLNRAILKELTKKLEAVEC